MIDSRTAEHEAAHITVGCALGLRLSEASALPREPDEGGWTWFAGSEPNSLRDAIMTAAGLAYEQRYGDPAIAAFDVQDLQQSGWGPVQIRQLTRAADGILMVLRPQWRKVVGLLEGQDTITAKDIEELIHD